MFSISVIGSGNVATTLAKAIHRNENGIALRQVIARNNERGKLLAESCKCSYSNDFHLCESSDLYIISVSDAAVSEVSSKIADAMDSGIISRQAIIAHTAGSVSIENIDNRIKKRGVFYPMQTISSTREIKPINIPLFIEGSDSQTEKTLMAIGEKLTGNVHKANSRQRAILHLSAVFACNFPNAMYAVAQRIVSEHGIDPAILNPLIKECADKAVESLTTAESLQTGPARRGDISTQQRHIELLKDNRQLQNIYKNISELIWETSKKI